METEEEGCGGCQHCKRAAPTSTIARNPINVTHPAQCQRCENEYYTFLCAGHPDDGQKFACGIMVDNMKAGNLGFNCVYRKLKPIAEVLDAEKEQEKAHMARLLAQGKRYQETGDVRSFTRPVIIAEEKVR